MEQIDRNKSTNIRASSQKDKQNSSINITIHTEQKTKFQKDKCKVVANKGINQVEELCSKVQNIFGLNQ